MTSFWRERERLVPYIPPNTKATRQTAVKMGVEANQPESNREVTQALVDALHGAEACQLIVAR